MYQKRTPGPTGTSCLTCKRRRKKCDRGRPACERCIKGGHGCLGYGHNDKDSLRSSLANSSRKSSLQEDKEIYTPLQSSPLGSPDDARTAIGTGRIRFIPFIPSPPKEQGDAPTSAPNIICATPHLGHHVPLAPDDGKGNSTPKHQSPLMVGSRELLPFWPPLASYQVHSAAGTLTPAPGGSIAHTRCSNQLASSSFYPWQSLQPPREHQVFSIPRNLPQVPTSTANVINYVLAQFERMVGLSYFKPVHYQVMRVKQTVSLRLQTSGATRWAMYLGAKISESSLEGVLPEKTAAHDHWIQKFERALQSTRTWARTDDQMQNQLSETLEVGFLKLRLQENYHILHLLRSCAPLFLQIALSDPTLWPTGSNFMTVSVAHILASKRYELGHYILLDVFCAMAYAVPPTLEYDTSYPPFNTGIYPMEWIHGCPVELHMNFIEINARCALGHVAPDWQGIERRIKLWQPRQYDPTGEAWKDVARLAVQESWRQGLLAYLYMAVCRVTSDDPRVQSAVDQIFRLLGTVRRQDPPALNVHCFVQYLIAGACTPSEKRRALVRSRMLDKFENRLWTLRGEDFVPVLDHLWHGAAANGRPIRWSDYMASRQIALPVPMQTPVVN